MPHAHYDEQRKDWVCDICGHVTDFCTCDVVDCCICDANCTTTYIVMDGLNYCPNCAREGGKVSELHDCGEGPWNDRVMADDFANAEVPEPYRVRFCDDDGLWHVDLVPYPHQ